MKKIQINNLENISGGLNGRSCMLLGGVAALALGGMQWSVLGGATITAIAGGCFNYAVNPDNPDLGQP